jgi:hypothetical protein
VCKFAQLDKEKSDTHVCVYIARFLCPLSLWPFTLREQLLGGERIERLSSRVVSKRGKREETRAQASFTMWISRPLFFLERTLFLSRVVAFFLISCGPARLSFWFFWPPVRLKFASLVELHHEHQREEVKEVCWSESLFSENQNSRRRKRPPQTLHRKNKRLPTPYYLFTHLPP